jgi:small subunit ribosomal protein S3
MGQKVHPYGLRLGIIRQSRSRWFADGATYREHLVEDLKVRQLVTQMHQNAGISQVLVDRTGDVMTVTIETAKPGVVIGRGGQDVELLRQRIQKLTSARVRVNVEEARDPDQNAQLVADNIARQIERRISYRRAMRQSVDRALKLGVQGIRVSVSGRLAGAEIARSETVGPEGRVPLHTLRADIEFGMAAARTTYGNVGVKVWIYKGDILPALRELPVEEEPEAAAEGSAAAAEADRPRLASRPAPTPASAPAPAAELEQLADEARLGPPLEADETPIVAAIEPEGNE